MTKFQGFPSGGKVQYTAIPNVFFSGLLPQITDVAELKTILYIMAALYTRKGSPRFIAFGELMENSALMQTIDNSEKKLRDALKMAVDHGALLSLSMEGEGTSQDIYFLNDEPNRQAVEKIKNGELKLPGLKTGKSAPAVAEPLPDIFTLYEQNIGMLTPMIADELRDAESRYPAGWIHDAIKEAVLHNKRNIRYISKILENWSVEGRSDGTYQRDSKATGPQKYFKGKYGHMVRR
jgi:DNA replication protein